MRFLEDSYCENLFSIRVNVAHLAEAVLAQVLTWHTCVP